MRTRKRRTRETRRRKRKKGPVEGEETKGRVEGERPTGDVDSRDGDSKPPTEAPRTRKAIRQACDETANNARPVGASACRASGASDEAVHAHAQGCPASEQEGDSCPHLIHGPRTRRSQRAHLHSGQRNNTSWVTREALPGTTDRKQARLDVAFMMLCTHPQYPTSAPSARESSRLRQQRQCHAYKYHITLARHRGRPVRRIHC